MSGPFLVHCHVPKTGGSALNRRFLYPAFGEDRVYQLYRFVFERASRLPHRHVSRAMRSYAATGHVPVGFFDRVYPDALYFSVFREPVERMLSFLNFVLSNPDHKVNARLPKGAVRHAAQDPDAYVNAVLDEPRLAVVQANVQTRIAGGAARLGDRPVSELHLDQAFENLSRSSYVVGDQSDLDDLIARLGERVPVLAAQCSSEPRSSAKLEKRLPRTLCLNALAPRTLDRIRGANDLDIRLYDRVRDRLAGPQRHAA